MIAHSTAGRLPLAPPGAPPASPRYRAKCRVCGRLSPRVTVKPFERIYRGQREAGRRGERVWGLASLGGGRPGLRIVWAFALCRDCLGLSK